MTLSRLVPILEPTPHAPEARLPHLPPFAPFIFLAVVACTDAASPTATELAGEWGGPDATVTLTQAGGTVEYACGSGTIDSGWKVGAEGAWRATGQYFSGGGPVPSEGRPPHAASYSGRVEGNILTFSVVVPDLGVVLGPYAVKRDTPGASEICV